MGVVLTTQRDRTELRRQTDICLTAELIVALTQRAVEHAEAVFQHEDDLQTAAQVFRAAQALAAALPLLVKKLCWPPVLFV